MVEGAGLGGVQVAGVHEGLLGFGVEDAADVEGDALVGVGGLDLELQMAEGLGQAGRADAEAGHGGEARGGELVAVAAGAAERPGITV